MRSGSGGLMFLGFVALDLAVVLIGWVFHQGSVLQLSPAGGGQCSHRSFAVHLPHYVLNLLPLSKRAACTVFSHCSAFASCCSPESRQVYCRLRVTQSGLLGVAVKYIILEGPRCSMISERKI